MEDIKLTGEQEPMSLKKQENLLLLGIFEHAEHGILLIENPYGELQLPGGKFQKFIGSPDPDQQTAKEVMKLQRRIFEKSGLLLQVEGCYVVYQDGNKKMQIKVFILTQNSIPLNEQAWERDLTYKAIYVNADPETISVLPNLNDRDKKIIIPYLAKRSHTVRGSICAVKNLRD